MLKTLCLVATFTVLMSSLPSLAQPSQADAVPTDMLIVGGGKTRADAEKAKAAFAKKVWLWARQKPEPAWPQIMKSDDVAGLNPGLFIAVAGLCRHDIHDAATRAAATKAVKAAEKGSYTKTVTGALGDLCLTKEMLGPGDATEKKLRADVDKAPSGKTLLAYAQYLKEQARLEEAREVVDEALTLDPKNVDAKNLAEMLMVLLTD